jgi:radical SAM superfamily enzyme YgiQ (UPF0313 family)
MKPSTILLINPWIYDFAAYDLWTKPLGFLGIASLLIKNKFLVKYIDCLDSFHPLMNQNENPTYFLRKKGGQGKFFKEIIEKPEILKGITRNYHRYGIKPEIFNFEIEKTSPDVILVTSGMTYWYPGLFVVISQLKKNFPSIPIIIGGIYPTLCYNHAKKFSRADYLLKGEGEISLLKLLERLTGKRIDYFPDPKNLDSYPYPAFYLQNKINYICLRTSRGCPYTCSYCSSYILNPAFKQRSPGGVIEEIRFWLNEYEVNNFAFYDDALLYNSHNHIIPILKGIIKENLSCNFHTPNGLHIREINSSLASLLKETGFKTLRFGLETIYPENQKRTGNKITNQEFRKAIKTLLSVGFKQDELGVYLLAGLPGQKWKEIKESIEFVWECGARPIIAEYSPIPGTKLWKESVTSSKYNLLEEPVFHNNSIFPCESKDFTKEHLFSLKSEIRGKTSKLFFTKN